MLVVSAVASRLGVYVVIVACFCPLVLCCIECCIECCVITLGFLCCDSGVFLSSGDLCHHTRVSIFYLLWRFLSFFLHVVSSSLKGDGAR